MLETNEKLKRALPALRLEAAPKSVVPLRERCWVSVDEARQVTGEGRTKIYELIALKKLLTKSGAAAFVSVVSSHSNTAVCNWRTAHRPRIPIIKLSADSPTAAPDAFI